MLGSQTHRLLIRGAFVIALVIAHEVPAQPVGPRPETIGIDLLTFRTTTSDSVRVDLYTAIPFTALEFLYARPDYRASYSMTVTLLDASTEHAVFDRFATYQVKEAAEAHAEGHAHDQARADAEQLSFMLRTNTSYIVRLALTDMNSHHEIDTEVSIRTHPYASPSLSDLLIYRGRRTSASGAPRVVPVIGGDVSSLPETSGVFAEAYDLKDTLLGVVAEVLAASTRDGAERADVVTRHTGILRANQSGITSIVQDISFSDLWAGHYRLRLLLLPNVGDTALPEEELERRAVASSERAISVRVSHGIPIATADLDEAIDQLRLIATAFEWDSLSEVQGASHAVTEKRAAIVEFWRKRDDEHPVSAMHSRPVDVFYARIAYANDHYSTSFLPGWKSDRGRVFVELGRPDFVERHPYEGNQKPYEVWEYTSPIHERFVFVDLYMLGDYRLQGGFPREGTFEWGNE